MDSQMRKISDFYPWTTESDLTNQFILCLDNNAFSGEFILHEAIIKLLKDGQNVYVISTSHSRKHYEAILRKNAMDLTQLESTGRIYIHFLLVGEDQAQSAWGALEAWQGNGMRSPSERDQNKCMCIVIDDMDAFEVFAPTAQKSRMFISRLIQSVSRRKANGSSSSGRVVSRLGRSSGGSCDVSVEVETTQGASSKINTVVAYGHIPHSHSQEHSNGNPFFTSSVQMNFLGNGNSKYEPSLTEYCRYRCDVCVCVQALSSGYSSEVHGLFTVTQTATQSSSDASRRFIGKDTNNSATGSVKSASAVQRQVVHYKALDSGVRCCLSTNT